VYLNENPSEKDIQRIIDGVISFGLAEVGGEKPLKKAVAAMSGYAVIGGAVGRAHVGQFYLDYLWVAESHRNRGVGSTLHDWVVEQARQSGCTDVWVNTLNEKAVRFYLKHGYRQRSCIENYVTKFDLHHLQLRLPAASET